MFPVEDLRTFLEHLTRKESLALLAAIKKPLLARSVREVTSLFQALDTLVVEQRPEAHSKSGYHLSLGGRELKYPSVEDLLTLLQLRLQALFQHATQEGAEIKAATAIHHHRDEMDKLLDAALRLFAMALASPPPDPRARITR